MLSFDQVQHKIVTLLTQTAPSYLAGITIVEDLGTQQNEKDTEDALRTKGVAITVFPPSDTKKLSQKAVGIFEFQAEVAVFFEINPETNNPANNPGGLNKDMMLLIKNGIQAVLAYRSPVSNPQDLFDLAEENPLKLDTFDAGKFTYRVLFSKRCVL